MRTETIYPRDGGGKLCRSSISASGSKLPSSIRGFQEVAIPIACDGVTTSKKATFPCCTTVLMSTRCVFIEPEPTVPPIQHIRIRIAAKVVPLSLRMPSIIPLFYKHSNKSSPSGRGAPSKARVLCPAWIKLNFKSMK